jgi:glycosyltransferase involved in cell wall biosynthesis
VEVNVIDAISMMPIASFPRGEGFFFPGFHFELSTGIPLICIPFVNMEPLKTPTAMLAFTVHILKRLLLQREQVKVILIYNLNLAFALPAFFMSRALKVPMVPIVADLPMPGSLSPDTLLRRLEAWAQKIVMRKTSGLIVLSRAMAMDFAPGRPFLYMEGGVSDDLISSPVLESNCATGDQQTKVLLYSGGLGYNGGVALLLDAFAQLANFEGELWICGRGLLEQKIRRIAQKDQRIHFLGFVGRKEFLHLLRQATLLINPRPSYPENRYSFPSKLLEYLASGRPVISTATADIAEEYRDYIFLLREETPEALANLIEKTCSLPSEYLNTFGAKARDYVLKHKTWDIQGHRVCQFLKKFISL